ncbi:MAG: cobyrinate a,c-diamide synthase, partial [Desulfatitalea sp.]|nr:cobyrinate a,c-diamide synthase [Desulfatitalea sp.]
LRTLGYREVELTGDTLLGGRGAVMRGHEFHYSALAEPVPAETIETVYLLRPRKGGAGRAEGYRTHHTLGSYVHLHFGSRPETAEAFVDACRAFKDAGKKCKK